MNMRVENNSWSVKSRPNHSMNVLVASLESLFESFNYGVTSS